MSSSSSFPSSASHSSDITLVTSQRTPIERLARYRTNVVEQSPWRGRLVTAGLVLGTLAALATAVALSAFGVLTANPLLLGLGLALGSCVVIGAISYISIHKALAQEQQLKLSLESTKAPILAVQRPLPAAERPGVLNASDGLEQPIEAIDDPFENLSGTSAPIQIDEPDSP